MYSMYISQRYKLICYAIEGNSNYILRKSGIIDVQHKEFAVQ